MWWSTREAPVPDRKRVAAEDIMEQVRATHRLWTDPVVTKLLGLVSCDSVYPTWTVGKLPTWGESGLVLVGDAAHALQPTSGQGSSQALEDAKCLALLLKHYVGEEMQQHAGTKNLDSAIHKSSKALYEIREPMVRAIASFADKMAKSKLDMGRVQEYFMYFFMWLMGRSTWIGE
jgi:2-polyprenyl-6-methoxyphenol hydroxylase-like FAD-dependent oxidoreductase